MTMDLFPQEAGELWQEWLGPQAVVLHGCAVEDAARLLASVTGVATLAPFRQMVTPGGFEMSVMTTSCGQFGWVSDSQGYRYSPVDPFSCKPWPEIPEHLLEFAARAADAAGFKSFIPDTCLINRYEPGTKMGLHQDRSERDFSQPIVSVSLGIPAVFQFGGLQRTAKTQRVLLHHGDVVVWGGTDRLRFHGVLPLKEHHHPQLGRRRINLTFRKAGI